MPNAREAREPSCQDGAASERGASLRGALRQPELADGARREDNTSPSGPMLAGHDEGPWLAGLGMVEAGWTDGSAWLAAEDAAWRLVEFEALETGMGA